MDPKRVIVNFSHISAFKALQNIVEQCGISSVLRVLSELSSEDDANMPTSIMNIPTREIDPPKKHYEPQLKFGSFNRYAGRQEE